MANVLTDHRSANPLAPGAAPAMRQRIIQHQGRRFSLKLEPEFWIWLEGLAAARHVRLNVLIAEIAGQLPKGANLASTLRQYCLSEAGQRIMRLEERVLDLSLAKGSTKLASIVEASPAPTLLVTHDRVILRVNGAFARWSGISRKDLIGRPFGHFFNFSAAAPIAEVWRRLGQGYDRPIPAKLTYLAPGRVVVAKATLCSASIKSPDDFTCLVMIDVTW